jgi:multidrug efflux pump subunit AcrA (membrane-fusion protein)
MEPDEVPAGKSFLGMLWEIGLILVVVAILGGSIFISYHWLKNKPKARRQAPQKKATLVEVTGVKRTTCRIEVQAMGTVIAARTVLLAPRVGGEIVEFSPNLAPGGRFDAGETVAVIDREDYELALKERQWELKRREADLVQLDCQISQRKADVIRARASLKLEQARRDLARKEYDLSGQKLTDEDRELVLRGPQLASAQAACTAAIAAQKAVEASVTGSQALRAIAKTALQRAQLNLRRTEVRIPFNAVVTARSAELGAQVSAGMGLATLVGTDEFWIVVNVPMAELRWIAVPGKAGAEGAEVRIFHSAAWGDGAFRVGRVIRLLPEVESKGRMARLLVSVEDPLALTPENKDRPRLILNAYVRTVIQGTTLEDAISVPRTALRDGANVWVMGNDDALEVRRLKILWHGRDVVFASTGLEEGDRLIVSDLGASVAGMPLRLPGPVGGRPPARGGRPEGNPDGGKPRNHRQH